MTTKTAVRCAAGVYIIALVVAINTSYSNMCDEAAQARRNLEFAQTTIQEQQDLIVAQQDLLHEYEYTLAGYNEPLRYRAAEPPLYDIPLEEDLQRYTYSLCVDYGIPTWYEFILAQMWKESDFNADIVGNVNRNGTLDYGLLQINEINVEWLNKTLGIKDLLDAKQNIRAGVYIVSTLVKQFEDEHLVSMAYQYGPTGAKRLWAVGRTSTEYSHELLRRRDIIRENRYNIAKPEEYICNININ